MVPGDGEEPSSFSESNSRPECSLEVWQHGLGVLHGTGTLSSFLLGSYHLSPEAALSCVEGPCSCRTHHSLFYPSDTKA